MPHSKQPWPLLFLLLAFAALLFVVDATSLKLESFNDGSPVLIRNGLVVDEFSEHPNTDVLIVGGKIQQIGKNLQNLSGFYEIDATDKIVMPGGIDPHTHISMPFCGTETIDDWYYASLGGLAGGTLTIFDFILAVDHSLGAGVEQWKNKVSNQGSWIDYSFHLAVTGVYGPKNSHPRNATLDTLAEMHMIVEDEGITSFKFFLAYKDVLMISDDEFLTGLQQCSALGAIALVHAENGLVVDVGIKDHLKKECYHPYCHVTSRPAILEAEATNRAALLAQYADAALYVVHVQSKGAVDAIKRVRKTYKRVIGEAVVSGFTLDERSIRDAEDFDTAAKYIMSPPFHIPEIDGVAIKKALVDGTLACVGTDHATFTTAQKRCIPSAKNNCTQENPQTFNFIPNGVNGLEERLALTYTNMVSSGLIDLPHFVRITSTNAAQIFGLYPRKGSMSRGADADIVIFDPKFQWVIDQAHQNIHPEVGNVFQDMEATGKVITSISRGEVLYEDLEFAPGIQKLKFMTESERRHYSRGRFVGREQFSSTLYQDDQQGHSKNNGQVYIDADGLLHVKQTARHDEL